MLRVIPAITLGVAERLWGVLDITKSLKDTEAARKKRGICISYTPHDEHLSDFAKALPLAQT
jgi:hypothetical protein